MTEPAKPASGEGPLEAVRAIAAGLGGARASGQIIHQLEQAILRGRLATGDRLPPERELRELLAVSRNTLREGLRVLEQKGLVEIRKGRRGGIFVKELGSGAMAEDLGLFVQSRRVTMEHISEFRQDLEGMLARRAAQRAAAGADLEPLRAPLAAARDLAAAGPEAWDSFMEADKAVHIALARVAGNPLHIFLLQTVHDNLHHYHVSAYLPRDERMIRITLEELEDLVAAVGRGDGDRAEAVARDHVSRATGIMQVRRREGERPNHSP
jgi:DNA-binding FadR family transcriptional regulator